MDALAPVVHRTLSLKSLLIHFHSPQQDLQAQMEGR